MKKVYIYAPVNGYIEPIENISDEVFANKMLGDGFVIKPATNEFYSFFEMANVEMIFETKHAIALKDTKSGCVGLLHVGLDTVALNGKYFEVFKNEGEKVTNKDKILKADLLAIEKKNIKTETAVVFEVNQFKNFKFVLKKQGEVKQGDLIAEISYDVETNAKGEMVELIKQENQFVKAAQQIYQLVGEKVNINDYYNCMTRLRIVIKNKNKVDTDAIKKIEMVKGINWNGTELQIIIGGTVVKLKDEFDKTFNNINRSITVPVKTAWYKKIMPTISGIMMPTIPMLMTIGMIGAIYNILKLSGAVTGMPESGNIQDVNVLSGVMYILSEVGLNLLGVVFIYSTVRYLKGNTIMAVFVGLTLITPLFGNGWELFKIGNTSITVASYSGKLLPFIIGGFAYHFLDKWVKTWMPASVDVIFRHTFCYLVTVFLILFGLGPIFGLLESAMAAAFLEIEKLPVGIGVGIFTLFWQPLVLTGTHVAVVTAMKPATMYSVMYLAILFGPTAQVAASLGVAAKTKDPKLKQIVYASIPAGIFGITEPIIYGVTLPRLKPFLFGCVAGAIGVLITANFGTKVNVQGWFTMGIVIFFNIGPSAIFIAWTVLGLLATIAVGFTLTYFFDYDRLSEFKGVRKTANNFVNNFSLLSKIGKKQAREKIFALFSDEIEQVKNKQKEFLEYENAFVKFQALNIKLEKVSEKEDKVKEKLYLKAIKNKENENYQELVKIYNDYNLNLKKEPLIQRKQNIVDDLDKMKAELENFKNSLQINIDNKVEQIAKDVNFNQILEYKNAFYNDLNSLEIFFGNIDAKLFKWEKKIFKEELQLRGSK